MAILNINHLTNELAKLEGPLYLMMVGLVGSGKSTIVKQLCEWDRFAVLSTDDIIEEHAKKMGLTYSQAFNRVNQKHVRQEFNLRLKDAVDCNHNIIVDQTNLMASARAKKLRQIPDHYTKVCVIVSVSEPVREKRLRDRELSEGKGIPDHVQSQMLRSYMTPSKTEGFDKLVQVQG